MPNCLILLNYCTIYAETKSVVLHLKKSLGLKRWKLVITLIIFMCDDVEKTPGSYNIAEIIQACFSQGHKRFGVTRWIQYT